MRGRGIRQRVGARRFFDNGAGTQRLEKTPALQVIFSGVSV